MDHPNSVNAALRWRSGDIEVLTLNATTCDALRAKHRDHQNFSKKDLLPFSITRASIEIRYPVGNCAVIGVYLTVSVPVLYNCTMRRGTSTVVTIDTSAILAVILGEPERDVIISATAGKDLVAPGSVPWEVGNAFSSMFKRKRLSVGQAEEGVALFQTIPIRFAIPDLVRAVRLSREYEIYAYDAYVLECAIRYEAPLLTLDRRLSSVARSAGVRTLGGLE